MTVWRRNIPSHWGRQGIDADYSGLYVARKSRNPTWTPTPNMMARDPSLRPVAGGHPNNPLGTHAVYFYKNNGADSLLRAHGTNRPDTIGTNASSGCFRMFNQHAEHLYTYVRIAPGPTDSPAGKSPLLAHRHGLLVPGMRYDQAHVMSRTDVAASIARESALAARGPRPTF